MMPASRAIVSIPIIYRATLWTLLAAMAVLAWLILRIALPSSGAQIVEPLPVVGATTLRPGDAVEVVVDYCTTDASFGWVGGVVASSGVITPLSMTWPETLPVGCHVVHLRLPLPSSLPPGSYRLYLARHYQPTLIASVQRYVASEPFEVVTGDAGR